MIFLGLLVVGQQLVGQLLVDCPGFSYSQLPHGCLHSFLAPSFWSRDSRINRVYDVYMYVTETLISFPMSTYFWRSFNLSILLKIKE